MSRRSFQILVIPFFRSRDRDYQYCIFKRKVDRYWQGIAGGGTIGEYPIQAAKREAYEEAGISASAKYFELETISSIPSYYFADLDVNNKNSYVIFNYCFAVKVDLIKMDLSAEHSEYQWVSYRKAKQLLHWDDNKTALWELNQKLLNCDL